MKNLKLVNIQVKTLKHINKYIYIYIYFFLKFKEYLNELVFYMAVYCFFLLCHCKMKMTSLPIEIRFKLVFLLDS